MAMKEKSKEFKAAERYCINADGSRLTAFVAGVLWERNNTITELCDQINADRIHFEYGTGILTFGGEKVHEMSNKHLINSIKKLKRCPITLERDAMIKMMETELNKYK